MQSFEVGALEGGGEVIGAQDWLGWLLVVVVWGAALLLLIYWKVPGDD